MTFTQYHDPKAFYQAVYDTMMRHEAQNILPLGNIMLGNRGTDTEGWRNPANWFMATVTDGDALLLTAIMTPPFNLTLYATDNALDAAAVQFLIDHMPVPYPGVTTTKPLAQLFTRLYCEKTGASHEIETDLRLYELESVKPDLLAAVRKPEYNLRLAEERDMAYLPYWGEGFNLDCFNAPITITEATADTYRAVINRRNRYILEHHGVPVTMAGINRELVTVCTIAAVYTPPYFRKKGYASLCVAAISQIGLEKGFKKCTLYTDLANPISNSIYMKIGYKPVSDSLQVKFV